MNNLLRFTLVYSFFMPLPAHSMNKLFEHLGNGGAIPVDMQFTAKSADTLAQVLPKVIDQTVERFKDKMPQAVEAFNIGMDGYVNNAGKFGNVNAQVIVTMGGAIEGFTERMKSIGLRFSAQWGLIAVGSIVGTALALKYIKKYTFEPSLIETKSSYSWFFKPKPMILTDHMVVNSALEKDLELITATTKNVKLHGGQFEHVLLYGAPGTGKTLFAQVLAQNCGMDYAIVPAANISQFLTDDTVVEKLNELFTWADRSSRGTIIFFDEAETFLAKRETLSTKANNALAAFLAKTGTPSNKIMIICATNRPEVLDSAVLSRMGEQIYFPLPDLPARYAQLVMHRNNVFEKTAGTAVNYDLLKNKTCLESMAQKTEGFSGRTLQKMINKLRQTALANGTLTITNALIDQVINKYKNGSLAATAA